MRVSLNINKFNNNNIDSITNIILKLLLCFSFCLVVFDIGTLPAYIPSYHSINHNANDNNNLENDVTNDSCNKYAWDKLVQVDLQYHLKKGGLMESNLKHTVKVWHDFIFHFQYLNGKWYISNIPSKKCTREGRVCWGRLLSFLEELQSINNRQLLKKNVKPNNVLDVLYSPWDEPLNISTYPVLQYNRKLDDFGMIIPYSYAFNHGQLRDYIVRKVRLKGNKLRSRSGNIFVIRQLEKCKQTSNAERKNVAIFRGSATYANSFMTSSRGILCKMLENSPKLRTYLDVGIISGEADGTYCGRTHDRISLREQASCYNMILDIEGQSYFTDRMVSLLLLNTTILRQERKGVDFLSPFYLQPWKHYIPVNYDFSNVEGRIHWAISKKNSKQIKAIRKNSIDIGLFRSSSEAIECAVWKNIETLLELKNYEGSLAILTEANNKNDAKQHWNRPLLLEPAYVYKTLIWERPGNSDWRLYVNIPGKPKQIYIGGLLFLFVSVVYFYLYSENVFVGKDNIKFSKYQ